MKKLIFALLLLSLDLSAQFTAGCQRATSLATATTDNAIDNRSRGCVAWRLTYYVENASAISIKLQGATSENGTYTDFSATPSEGSHPSTSTTPATVVIKEYWPWVRVNVTTLTGTNSRVIFTLLGYNGTAAWMPGSSSSGTVTDVTGTANEITVANGTTTPALSIASAFDISGKTSTAPIKKGTSLPATCGVGEMYFKTDATNTNVLYGCTATNTWTAQGGSTSTNMCSDMFSTPGAITLDTSAGSVNCIVAAGTYTVTAAITISAANVSIVCLTPGVILQQTTAGTNLFTLSGTGPINISGCALDKNSATGGSWIASTASKLTVVENVFQNGGTNSGNGLVAVTGGTDVDVSRNKFPGNPTDKVIQFSSSGANIAAWNINDNYITMNDSADYAIYLNGGANTVYAGSVSRNKIFPTGVCMRANLQTVVPQRIVIEGNICELQGATALEGYAIYGLRWGAFIGNIFSDGNNSIAGNPAFAWHDMHYSSAVGNIAYLFNSANAGVLGLDSNNNVISSNVVYGGRTTNATYLFNFGVGAPNSSISNNTFIGNKVILAASSAATCYRLAIGLAAGDTLNATTFSGNSCHGDNTANSDGLEISTASGASLDGTLITGNVFDDVATGITVGSGVTNTKIGADNMFRSVTTEVSDSGTTTIWDGKGANVASAGTTTLTAGGVIHITGTTTITTLNTCSSLTGGKVITLIFDGILTFTDGSNLKLAGNMTTSADDTITLVCDGTNWYEIARSVN